jgi:hypothetical protein
MAKKVREITRQELIDNLRKEIEKIYTGEFFLDGDEDDLIVIVELLKDALDNKLVTLEEVGVTKINFLDLLCRSLRDITRAIH